MIRVYMAARYGRREELCGYARELERTGRFFVAARWLSGAHQIDDFGNRISDDEGHSRERAVVRGTPAAARALLKDDVEDAMACDMLIAFTEPPRSGASRGGRHVELGMALARVDLGHDPVILIVGPRENLFCWHPLIEQFDTWGECMEHLS